MKHSYKKRLLEDNGIRVYGVFNRKHECVGRSENFPDARTSARLYEPGTFVLNQAGDVAYTAN